MRKVALSIRLPEELHDKAGWGTFSLGISFNQLVIDALNYYLDKVVLPSKFRLGIDYTDGTATMCLVEDRKGILHVLGIKKCSNRPFRAFQQLVSKTKTPITHAMRRDLLWLEKKFEESKQVKKLRKKPKSK